MALELGQIEVGTGAAGDELGGVVEEVEPEVHEARRDGLAVDEEVALGQVPSAGADDEGRRFLAECVVLPVRRHGDRPPDGVHEVGLTPHHVLPRRGGGVLEVGHEDPGSRVERVDHHHHLAVDGAGDLDAAVHEIRGRANDRPVGRSHPGGLVEESRHLARVDAALPGGARREELGTRLAEGTVEFGNERERIG